MKITYFQRHPFPGAHSIEKLFTEIRNALPYRTSFSVSVATYPSKGFLPRLLNSVEAAWRQSDINHITGDIHYIATFLRKKKTILTIHDCVMLERLHGVKKAILFFFWYWLPEKRCALITVVSESTKKEVLKYLRCNPDKIRVVRNCVSADLLPFPQEFNPENPRILQVGTSTNKNLLRVAEALEGIRCHLRIIGKLSDEQKVALERKEIDHTCVSNISNEELVQNYRDCDLVMFVSTYEGFGLPILEANAIGRPVITSDLFSMPEVAGDAACIVDPFSVESIRAGILRIIGDANYRNILIRNGFANIERFKPQTVSAEYVKLYEQLLSPS